MSHFSLSFSTVVVVLSVSLVGCQKSDDYAAETSADETAVAASHSIAEPDTTGAAVWKHLQDSDYQNEWALWPDKGELYTGREPHGMLLTTYLNDLAAEALASHAGEMPAGAIIVKENYTPDSVLAAVTVMFKSAGYNPDHSDWFFSKHKADGSLDTTPSGMAMEGRLAGCQNCHGSVSANDYVFTGSLTE